MTDNFGWQEFGWVLDATYPTLGMLMFQTALVRENLGAMTIFRRTDNKDKMSVAQKIASNVDQRWQIQLMSCTLPGLPRKTHAQPSTCNSISTRYRSQPLQGSTTCGEADGEVL
jgi:hypothetical protein